MGTGRTGDGRRDPILRAEPRGNGVGGSQGFPESDIVDVVDCGFDDDDT